MAAFEVNNLEINSKLPEWWKNDTFLEPLNRYTQALIIGLVGDLLNNLGVAQPFNVWKWLPEEYNWVHNYYSSDSYLEGRDATLKPDFVTHAIIPNTKRRCDAIITLSLTGNNHSPMDEHGEFDKHYRENVDITIKNGMQQVVIKNISNLSTIEIFTESNEILIDGVLNNDLIEGSLGKIQPIIKNPTYQESYIDEDGNTQYQHIDISDENKVTRLELSASKEVNFDLKVELIRPVYVTEQHMRLATVSAFPLEWVKLYGFYCHEFNDREGYQLLWTKNYDTDDRIVYDKIATQFDCERFYIQVKLYGIGIPLQFGFPQQQLSENPAFAINTKLDDWGKIFGLPRRTYRNDISEDEEYNTFPQYYNYNIEQDYWYEERMINEYRYNDDATSGLFIKDSDLNNVALLESISPNINDVWVFTETITPTTDIHRQTGEIYPCKVTEIDDLGVAWEVPQALKKKTYISQLMELQPQNDTALNDYSYKTKSLRLRYNLRDLNIPKNIEITGVHLRFYAETDMHSAKLRLDPLRSRMLLTSIHRPDADTIFSTENEIDITNDIETWDKGKKTYHVGGKNDLFNLDKIDREQLFKKFDNNSEEIETGYLDFIIAFENISDAIVAKLLLHTVTLEIYYKLYQDDFNINMKLSDKDIVLSQDEHTFNIEVNVENVGQTEIENKQIFIATSPELQILDNKDSFDFSLDIGESFTIGNQKGINKYGEEYNDPNDVIKVQCTNRTGRYDIILFCDDKVIKDEIIIREGFE